MRPRLFCAVLLVLLAGGLAAGCGTSSSSMSRIQANRALYESWPVDMKQAVLESRVEEGMTADMVQMSIGRPTSVGYRGAQEVWVYRKSSGINLPVSVAIPVGGAAVYAGGGSGGSVSAFEVVFENGKVVSVSQVP